MKFPANDYVLGVVSNEGDVMSPHFFKKRKTVTKEMYLRIFDGCSETWMDGNCGMRKATCFSAAPAHTSHLIQNWLSDNVDMF